MYINLKIPLLLRLTPRNKRTTIRDDQLAICGDAGSLELTSRTNLAFLQQGLPHGTVGGRRRFNLVLLLFRQHCPCERTTHTNAKFQYKSWSAWQKKTARLLTTNMNHSKLDEANLLFDKNPGSFLWSGLCQLLSGEREHRIGTLFPGSSVMPSRTDIQSFGTSCGQKPRSTLRRMSTGQGREGGQSGKYASLAKRFPNENFQVSHGKARHWIRQKASLKYNCMHHNAYTYLFYSCRTPKLENDPFTSCTNAWYVKEEL